MNILISSEFSTPSLVVKTGSSLKDLLLSKKLYFLNWIQNGLLQVLNKTQILQEEDCGASGHENLFHRFTHCKHTVQMYSFPIIYSPQY